MDPYQITVGICGHLGLTAEQTAQVWAGIKHNSPGDIVYDIAAAIKRLGFATEWR